MAQTRQAQRAQWAAAFGTAWRVLGKRHGEVKLTPDLMRAAVQLRDRDHDPMRTAAGLYWGTRDAERQAQA